MRLLVEYSHPAQVHKFKHVLRELMDRGDEVLILSRDKDVMIPLLDGLGLPHVCISKARSGLLGMSMELLQRELRTLAWFFRFRPDMVLSAHSVAVTHVGWLFRIPRVVHDDTEHAKLQQSLYMPFASHIVTTTAYNKEWGARQVRINSLEPLAYLHPDNFEPDPAIAGKYALSSAEPYAVVRFVAWQAAHDNRHRARSEGSREGLLRQLIDAGAKKIVMTSENTLDLEMPEIVKIDPLDFHHVLAFARLCVTEGGSVAYEAAVLGVPTVLTNPLRCGYFDELERYGLLARSGTLEEGISCAKSGDKIRPCAATPTSPWRWGRAATVFEELKSVLTAGSTQPCDAPIPAIGIRRRF